ncbi:MAG: methionine biosynthesis protein MetW [Candidatus Oxydemutatoraceae bacterium WSBS_2016_MAG_OTU14]
MRNDLEIIYSWIKDDSRVLDVGCGDGTLLRFLTSKKNVQGLGLEVDDKKVVQCIKNDINVIQIGRHESLLEYFQHGMFDYVIMTQTLQALPCPLKSLNEMLEIGREVVITLPNMGYWRNRLQFLLSGRMPMTRALPDTWYETENIHLCTISDFNLLCAENNIRILDCTTVKSMHRTRRWTQWVPNWLGEIALYRITRA